MEDPFNLRKTCLYCKAESKSKCKAGKTFNQPTPWYNIKPNEQVLQGILRNTAIRDWNGALQKINRTQQNTITNKKQQRIYIYRADTTRHANTKH